ncbi:MAG: hypothetical protein SWY16_11950 [Cyanobacteriota bacterium]|nr:hypothetical protein [Cyanobacteriota bacterium]
MSYSKFVRKYLGRSIAVGVVLLWGCNGSESEDVSAKNSETFLPEIEQTQPVTGVGGDESAAPEISAETSVQDNEGSGNSTELLYGQWSPSLYIAPDGTSENLSGLPEADKDEFSWEFTPDGRVFSGGEEGMFTVEGDTIAIENVDSGDITQFEFVVSEDELTLASDTNATLKLNRRGG